MDVEMQRLVALEHEPSVGGIAREHRIEPVGELLVVRCREDSGERGASGQVPIQARTDALNLVARHAGRLRLAQLISGRFPLDRTKAAIDAMQAGTAVKTGVVPGLSGRGSGPPAPQPPARVRAGVVERVAAGRRVE